jgi:hypothetical protein
LTGFGAIVWRARRVLRYQETGERGRLGAATDNKNKRAKSNMETASSISSAESREGGNGGANSDAPDHDPDSTAASLPLGGGTPMMPAAFGAAGGLSTATVGTAPLAGAVVPLGVPVIAGHATSSTNEGGDANAQATLEETAHASTGDDGYLAGRIEAALAEDGRLRDVSRVVVSARGGVVDLRGNVGSDYERTLAERIAAHLPGVAAVRNGLSVGAE